MGRKPVASATKVIQLSGKRRGRPPKVGTQPEATKRGAVPHTESTATGARRGRKPKVAQEESGPATTVDGTHVLSGKRKGRPPKVGTQPEAKKPAVQAVLAKPAGSNAAEDVSQVVSRPAASAVVASPAATILLAKPAGVNAPEAGVPSVESGVNEMRKPANAESNVLRKPVASATKVIQFSVKRRGRPPKVGTQPEAKERGAVPRTECGCQSPICFLERVVDSRLPREGWVLDAFTIACGLLASRSRAWMPSSIGSTAALPSGSSWPTSQRSASLWPRPEWRSPSHVCCATWQPCKRTNTASRRPKLTLP